jgi:VCBS repeat-containing protein
VNFFGTETFTYTVRNQANETSTATFTVQVAAKNDPPVAGNDTANATAGGQAVVINVLANDTVGVDTNENVQNYTVTAVTQPASGGTVAITAGGKSVTFTPASTLTSNVTFTYTISDGNGGTSTATVTINNDNPNVVNDTSTVAEDSSGNLINVLGNDTPGTGPNAGTNLSVSGVGTPTKGGTVTIGQNGNVVYTPAANFQGTETFTYTVSDGNSHTSTGTVTVTVTNSNDPPTATGDTVTAFKNTPAVFDVLANDSSAPDPTETLTIDSVTQPAHGTVQITNNGTRITYTPTNNYTGPDSFTYIIKDPSGAVSQSATVTVNVQEFIPSSLAGFVYFDVDNDGRKDAGESAIAGVTVTLTGTDINNAAVNRTLKTGADGSYKFDSLLPGNYTITETQPAFTIDGKDKVGGQGGTSTQSDKIVINQLAQNTNGTNNNFGERGRQSSSITLRDFFVSSSKNHLTAAVNGSGAALWHSIKGNAFSAYTNPIVSIVNGSQVKVEGTNGQSNPVTASLPIDDSRVRLLSNGGGNRLFQISSFPLTTPAANVAPVAVNDTFTVGEDATLTAAVANGVLKNDTDANGNPLTAVVVTQPAHGTLTLNANGSFTYVPTANYSGPDSFTYKANDGTVDSAVATANITVTAVNDSPTATANSYNVVLNTALTINQANGVLANDIDPENATLTATVVTQPAHGTLTLNANGSFTYTPTNGYTGPDSFTYRAGDGTTQSQPATVSLTVAQNAAPTAVADQYSVNEDAVLTVNVATGVLSNDTDSNSQSLTAIAVAQPAHGTLTLNANGSFTYTPAANYNGPDSFTYKANDGALDSSTVTVSLTVNAVNDAPLPVDDSFTTPAGTPLSIAAPGILSNDTDLENNSLIVLTTPVSGVAHGTLTLNADGSFTYTPEAGFTGTDTFTYRLNDGTDPSQPGTVTITVQAAGGGEGESAGDQGLAAYLSESGADQSDGSLAGGSENWSDAVDEILSQL